MKSQEASNDQADHLFALTFLLSSDIHDLIFINAYLIVQNIEPPPKLCILRKNSLKLLGESLDANGHFFDGLQGDRERNIKEDSEVEKESELSINFSRWA